MKVELISVGTELLLGNIVNTNAAYLAEKCAQLGLSCYYQSVVGDNEERLCNAIEEGLKRSDILILSGGLGPTKDDLTKECAAKVWQLPLEKDESWVLRIREYFSSRGRQIPENNWKQAEVPRGAILVENENGTAPGLIMSKGGKHILLLPGPPLELIPMFEEKMVPFLESLQPGIIYSKTVKLCGIGESEAETMVLDLIKAQKNPTIAPYAKTGEVHFRLTAKAESREEAIELLRPLLECLKERFGDKIYTTTGDQTLEENVISLLEERQMTLGLAESCTGGLLSGRITSVPGVSSVFTTGLVTYANEAKEALLGVKKETLETEGAVSTKTAEEMVQGLCQRYGVSAGISITGIAGPGGGTEEKKVGFVCIGCQVRDHVVVKEYHFSGNRKKIRESTVTAALVLLRNCLLTVQP